jgi:hypothetical protein
LLLAPFQIPQNRRVDIDRRSRHDELMIDLFASDVIGGYRELDLRSELPRVQFHDKQRSALPFDVPGD